MYCVNLFCELIEDALQSKQNTANIYSRKEEALDEIYPVYDDD